MSSKSKKKTAAKKPNKTKQNASKQNKAKKPSTKKQPKKQIQNKSMKQKQNKKDTKKSKNTNSATDKKNKTKKAAPSPPKKTQKIQSTNKQKPKPNKKPTQKKPQKKAETKNQSNKKKQNTTKTNPKKSQNQQNIKKGQKHVKKQTENSKKPQKNKKTESKPQALTSIKWSAVRPRDTKQTQTKKPKASTNNKKQNTNKTEPKKPVKTTKNIKNIKNGKTTAEKQPNKPTKTTKNIKNSTNTAEKQPKKAKKLSRKHIQRKKDIETAKNRLNKRQSLKATPSYEITVKKPEKAPKEKEKTKRAKSKQTKEKMVTVSDSDFWSDYVSKYGDEAQTASQIQAFSKTDSKYTTLNYKSAKKIFDSMSTNKEELKSDTKSDRDKIYIKRDLSNAKKRLSQRLNTKQINIIQKQVIQTDTNTIKDKTDTNDDNEEIVLDIISETGSGTESLQTESSSDTEEEKEKEEDDIKEEKQYVPPLPKRSTVDVFEQFKRNKIQQKAKNTSKPSLPKRTRRGTQYKAYTKGTKVQRQPTAQRRQTVGANRGNTSGSKGTQSIIEIEKFIESERVYVKRGLRICYETFLHRLEIHNTLKESILNEDDVSAVFGNYAMIYNINSKLFGDLMELRLNGVYALRDGLGQVMVNFIPYFRMYTEYIVKKHSAITRMERLKKSNKKFKQFLKVNETCVKRKLKSFLEEPVHRLPEYLQYLGQIYASYKSESNVNNVGQQLLLQSIVDIKNVSDEIALKCRDVKSRMLVGSLQKDVFGNKIQLLSAHRLCIAHCVLKMFLSNYKEKKLKSYNLILCNDILLISTVQSTFKSSNLISVLPLSGLRVCRQPAINADNVKEMKNIRYRFSLLPSNHILICANETQILKWIETIEDAVEEQEFSLKQCNVIDLEKRIRKQKTSSEGEAEVVNVTDPYRIKQIEAWRKEKYGQYTAVNIEEEINQHKQECIAATGTSPPVYAPEPKRRVTFNDNKPSLPPRPPPLDMKKTSFDAVAAAGKPSPRQLPAPPARRNTIDGLDIGLIGDKTSKNGDDNEDKEDKVLGLRRKTMGDAKVSKKDDVNVNVKSRRKTVDVKVKTKRKHLGDPKTFRKEKRRMRMGSNLLRGITAFQSENLSHVDAETLKSKAESEPENMTNLLQSTLKTYRQFVMDDDDDDDDSDGEWSD